MRIYLYLLNKVLNFSIPTSISGSFSFDENQDEETKLINIEARDGKWVLYSTFDVVVMDNGKEVDNTELLPDRFYNLKRKENVYLIYVSKLFDDTYLPYSYSDNTNIVIGNDNSATIMYKNPLISGICCTINNREGVFSLTANNTPVYVDGKAIVNNTINLKNGDYVDIYGLKLMLASGFFLINNPMKSVSINGSACNLEPLSMQTLSQPTDVEIKDTDLYKKEDYYSKSPRIRRLIETKEITLSPPPSSGGDKELPLILTLGPALGMGLVSVFRFVSIISNIASGKTTFDQSFMSLLQSGVMLLSSLVWPTISRFFNKHLQKKRREELIKKYTKYLDEKKVELANEEKLQREILNENLLSVEKCLQIIEQGKINFWDKRIEQNDFLEVFMGNGNVELDAKVNYPERGFTIEEDELRKKADEMVEQYKYIKNVPVGYSLFNNRITGLMGDKIQTYGMINNIILQLITFYTYEDVKIVVFTNDENKKEWDYVKYLSHNFSNDKSIRFFSTNIETAKTLADYFGQEIAIRLQSAQEGQRLFKPHYVIITDDYYQIKRLGFTKTLTEVEANLGYSLIILENQMSKLPSKCNNFITMSNGTSAILMDSFENAKQITFKDQINYNIDMMSVARKISNIPIEFEEASGQLPNAITFLEMEKVGKVEQLNILNRWNQNDSTKSLRAEVGVDEEGNLMYLDLHEKYHGPHGLIAGMTGSGKSEFIITYILSMAINYSPDDVSFILIDYKGGGLAGAFENKTTGMILPHLAGVITNLDKAEMDRTLVSIDSEIKRRQQLFNDARDKLGESTIDIYKYQGFYKEGKLTEACPHLFIICDEFAELKSQQPDFMDNLISVARIGRSLGVHLILATQKPSGVVNDQIWSNTKFRVCLKVQDASDSREMLKRPEAASIKQTGRFYLQVGYDEYFALGQSGWCGAKYYPSERIIKQVDKTINFVDDSGNFIKSIQAGNNVAKVEAQGEQLAAIMKNIIEVAKMTNKKANRLWLTDIDPIILIDDLKKKYKYDPSDYNVEAIIGEYDAPEKQEQGLLKYNLKENGNTIVYGSDELERENFVNSLLYSVCSTYTSDEVNVYVVDYGSEQTRMFNNFPQVGGLVFAGEDEKFRNLFKLIDDEIKERKKLLLDYGGSIDTYNSKNEKKLPQILFVLNNYEGILESYNNLYEEVVPMSRECERYGITMVLVCNTTSSAGRRVINNFGNEYAFHMTDASDYYVIFNCKTPKPRDRAGRGLANNDGIHEFQNASIVKQEDNLNEFIQNVCEKIKELDKGKAKPIPSLPEKVTMDLVKNEITTLDKLPIGIGKNTLKVVKYNFIQYPLTNVVANKLNYINSFMDSLLDVLLNVKELNIFFIDSLQLLPSAKKATKDNKINYFDDKFDDAIDKMIKDSSKKKGRSIYIFYGIDKLRLRVNPTKLDQLFTAVKASETSSIIVAEGAKSSKAVEMETWYSKVRNNTDGIWIGSGISEQQNFRINRISREMGQKLNNNYGYYLDDSNASLMKFIEFNDLLRGEDDDEE